MSLSDYAIRRMTRKDLAVAVAWAANEGWNPGMHDADNFFTADPNGYFIGELNHEPVATLSAVTYGNAFGFLGFYMVKPEYRGKGFGMQIWNAGLEYLKGRNIGLDGVVSQQDNYRKSGFKLAYRNIRYEGVSGGEPSGQLAIEVLSTLPFDLVDLYDRQFFPARRSQFLAPWIRQPESTALGIMQGGTLVGYGVIRKCRTGYKVGPLFADTSKLAEALFLALNASIPSSEPVFLDVPEVNRHAVALAEGHNMKAVFETARMYTGISPDVALERLYGVTSFELG